jgi:hypothetical protein
MASRGRIVVLSNPAPGKEKEYDRWYQDVHLADVVAVPGVSAAQRFALAGDVDGAPHRFLALYDIDGDPADVWAEIRRRAGTDAMRLSDAVDRSSTSTTLWRAHGEPVSGTSGPGASSA